MGLMQKAVETYNAYVNLAGVIEEGKEPLAPVGHIIAKATVEVQIDKNGHFVNASFFTITKEKNGKAKTEKGAKKIIIPVTEESSSRAGKVVRPHPLCDQYEFVGITTDGNAKKHEAYVTQLEKWADACHNEKVDAVLKYVKGNTLPDDLARVGIEVNDKDFIAWRVLGSAGNSAVWEDKNLFECWTEYITRMKEGSGDAVLSLVSGEYGPAATLHIKGVVPSQGNAKIISANNPSIYTFQGRFLTADEALTVNYSDSQKAHNALRWLVANNGVNFGDPNKRLRTLICWNPHKRINDKNALFKALPAAKSAGTLADYRKNLRVAVLGMKDELSSDPNLSTLVIASFEAASPGRLAITYYQELQESDFLDMTERWATSCCWIHWRNGEQVIGTPDLRDIVKYAFGTSRDSGIKVDEKVEGMHIQRLLFCRLDNSPVPRDIVRALVRNVTSPRKYEQKYRGELLFTACAVLKKYRNDKYKEEWNTMLEPEKKDRSYQYGRLLAVMEKVERDATPDGENREPNAVRMREIFSRRPAYASKIILEQLDKAYYKKLEKKSEIYYRKLINEILDVIPTCGEDIGKPLTETYIFGYASQNMELYKKKQEEK